MRCLRCNRDIGAKPVCPYCGYSVKEAAAERKRQDEKLQESFMQIDEAYGLSVNYVKMSTEDLEKFFESVNSRFEEDSRNHALTMKEIEKISQHIDSVEETLQGRYPIREEAYFKPQKKTVGVQDFVLCLLNDYNPPKLAAAAFQLRETCERQVKDYYKLKIKNKYNEEGLSWPEIFSAITHRPRNSSTVKKLLHYRKFLNYFVHGSKMNDKLIKDTFKTVAKQKQYIVDTLNLFEEHNLIGDK